jgi:hypothetical protein
MFLADFDLGAPQQRHMETENRLQRSRVTETYTADGTRFRGVREADVTHLKKSRDNSLCSFGRRGVNALSRYGIAS